MVALLLAAHCRAIAGRTTAHDVVDLLEGIDLHSLNVVRSDAVLVAEPNQAFQSRLRVALCVVALDAAVQETVERLFGPVDHHALAHDLLPALRTFHQVQGAGYAPHRKQRHVHASHRRLG